MDLLGLISSENLFELWRINWKNYKVRSWSSTNAMGQITAFTFNPAGDNVLLATDKGYFVLVKTDSGGDLFNLTLKEHSAEIVYLNWINYGKNIDRVGLNPLNRHSQLDRFLPVIEPHKHSNKENLLKLNLFKETPENFSLLISADLLGIMHVTLNGIFPIVEINFSEKVDKFHISQKHPFIAENSQVFQSRDPSSDPLAPANIEKSIINDNCSKLI